MITIIDYGAGNIKSIRNMLKKIGVESCISKEPEVIAQASKLILPGVGHFDYGMKSLRTSGLVEVLYQSVMVNKIPILGICLGAQLLGKSSEESEEQGLSWLDMEVVRFDSFRMDESLNVPHMGWNEIKQEKESLLLAGYEEIPKFYFVHTYHMKPIDPSDILTTTNYGYDFTSAVEKDNIFGVQFHPEKSHKFGMKVLMNFSKI